MAYLAFYRLFRPATFDGVVRQEHIVRTLKNQIAANKIGHAYLFCGPRGTGKTSLARIFARAINCEHPLNGSPCGECETCKQLANGSNLDIMEIDAASNNGVDEMRDLREKVQYPPVAGKYKVYIIDEVHMLSPSAFNAVLKTLEEPPAHAVFILATTEPQKIPATIGSRCMRFDFKLIPLHDLEEYLKVILRKAGKDFEDEAVTAIARAGAGSVRDSLSIADMCASYSGDKITYADVNAVLGSADFAKISSIVRAILTEDAPLALSLVEEVLSTGKSVGVLIRDMLNFLNSCAVAAICKNPREILNLPEENFEAVDSLAKACDGHKILRVTEILAKAETDLRFALSGRITLETAVLKCAMPESDYDIDALIGKISMLEKKIEAMQHSPAAAPRPAADVKPAESEPAPPPRIVVDESGEDDPFAKPKAEKAVQPTLWEEAPAAVEKAALGESEKKSAFGRFIRALRTTHKNAVLFTLCMDLDNHFEGDTLVLETPTEAVYKALMREDNSAFISDVLLQTGVEKYEIRLKKAGENKLDSALKALKDNFDGTDIDIK